VSALVLAGLTGFVVLVYLVVVLGVGALVRRTSSPDLALSVAATIVVALAFDPVQSVLERAAARLVYRGTTPPYDVWERFSSTVTGSYPAEELPARMARVLAEGTGAKAAEVWLVVDGRPTPAATWPPHASPVDERAPGRRVLPVRYAGEELGLLVVVEDAPLTAVEERLFTGLAGQAGLVLRSARLRAELESRIAEQRSRAEELRLSRQRLVDVQDERRRALERNIHDGAQQHLVALAVNLRLVQTVAARSPDRARQLLEAQRKATAEAIETLAQLTRGIYPPRLAEEGLASAVRAAAATSPVPVSIETDGVGRYRPQVEAAAYFTCLEALQNVAKHARATRVRVSLRAGPDALLLTVEDDGVGFEGTGPSSGTGLANLRDRVESVGGTLTTESAPGHGTRVEAVLPAVLGSGG
jgi:signal transduction histidine kinase